MKPWMQLLISILSISPLGACTEIKPIRVDPPPQNAADHSTRLLPRPKISPEEIVSGRTGTPTALENKQIIEEYQDYFIGFAEFDDQGWAYSNGQQLDVINQRVAADLADPAYKEKDFLVLVFVHGWHHNAHDNDSNVQEFRQMVDIAANGLETGIQNGFLKTHRRIIGIYVGWRGESVNALPFNYLTVIDRRNAAERVAMGAVRQLFANLRQQQLVAQGAFRDDGPTPARMRTVVIGPSFGGQIAFSALSQAELNELTLDGNQTPSPQHCDPAAPWHARTYRPPLWPDALILINPAFEASRYESFDQLMRRSRTWTPPLAAAAPAADSNRLVVPHFIVVASETDHWTGKYFTTGRALATLFEGYDRTSPDATRAERKANLHSIAYVDSYRTHRLTLTKGTPPKAVAQLEPAFAGKGPFASPVWIVMASDAIVHGHDGFLYGVLDKKDPQPYLANWLLGLYDMDCSTAPEMVDCAK
jgi:hypothetical protein